MPNSLLLWLGISSVLVGAMLILFPKGLLKLSTALNRSRAWDQWLIRHRYVVGSGAFLGGCAFFRLALFLLSAH